MAIKDIHTQQLLAMWAASCAEHVLSNFEADLLDDRPRKAIESARAWARGEITVAEARKFAFAAHAAARSACNTQSVAAARAAGHAAATAHIPGHAKYAALYALRAAKDPNKEIEWQLQNLPDNCKSIIELSSKKVK